MLIQINNWRFRKKSYRVRFLEEKAKSASLRKLSTRTSCKEHHITVGGISNQYTSYPNR
jgi:hypothetical protein